VLALWQSEGSPELAFVSCYSDRRVSVVSLDTFSVTRTLTLGEGPNELLVDHARKRLYVGNVLEDSVSVVSLDNTNAAYLTEVATIGLGASRTAAP
jgi:DNA-binding beta-propeller fold protein YncE